MTSRFTGDPLLLLTKEGADLEFIDGQPTMDHGIANQVLISLFSNKWFVNVLLPKGERLQSDVEKASLKPITSTGLNAIREAAVRALNGLLETKVLSEINIQAINRTGNQIILYGLLKLSNGYVKQFLASNADRYWQYQLRNIE